MFCMWKITCHGDGMLLRPTETKNFFAHLSSSSNLLSGFFLLFTVSILMIPKLCHNPTFLDNLWLLVASLRWPPLWRPLVDEKALYLFVTHLDVKLLSNNVSFIAPWPGSRCISLQPPSVSSLKTLPSWVPVFPLLCPHSLRLGQVPAGCHQNGPDVCL